MFEVPVGTDPAKRPKTRKQRKIPQSGTPATIKAVIGLIWIFMFLKFAKWYNTDLVLGEQYMQYGFLRRIWLLEMLGFATRMKYYGVWYLTEGACILSGLGYKGIDTKTGKVNWNRLQNVNPWGIESAQNSRAYLENWNMNTNHWLRNYMYLRVTPKGKKPGFRASLATFVTSAFWHGFYPGYYLTFVLAAFLQTIAKSESFTIPVPALMFFHLSIYHVSSFKPLLRMVLNACSKSDHPRNSKIYFASATPSYLTAKVLSASANINFHKTSAATSVPSSLHQTVKSQQPTSPTTTSYPT